MPACNDSKSAKAGVPANCGDPGWLMASILCIQDDIWLDAYKAARLFKKSATANAIKGVSPHLNTSMGARIAAQQVHVGLDEASFLAG